MKEKEITKTKKNNANSIKLDISDKIVRGFGYTFITCFALACLFPFLLIISTSFSTEDLIRRTGFTIIPKGFTTYSYGLIFRNYKQIVGAYAVTITMTVCGTALGLILIAMTGYALQRKDFPFRNVISFYIYFTTLFQAGLAPFYLLMTNTYHLKDN